MFAKTTVFILFIVCGCLGITLFTFFYQGFLMVSRYSRLFMLWTLFDITVQICTEIQVPIPDSNTLIRNVTENVTRNYTGLEGATFDSNLWPEYGRDYTAKGELVTFATVFGVLFSGVTGIMAGANMSGRCNSIIYCIITEKNISQFKVIKYNNTLLRQSYTRKREMYLNK